MKDPSDRKVRPRPTCRFFMKGNCPPEGLRAATCGLSLSSRDAVRSGLVAGPGACAQLFWGQAVTVCGGGGGSGALCGSLS